MDLNSLNLDLIESCCFEKFITTRKKLCLAENEGTVIVTTAVCLLAIEPGALQLLGEDASGVSVSPTLLSVILWEGCRH